MTSYSAQDVKATAEALELPQGAVSIVDIGGGNGSLLTSILKTHPSLTYGTLLDLPGVIERAWKMENIQELENEGRLTLKAGDMFEPGSIPGGLDVYVLQHVIVDYQDDVASKLLKNIYDAMKIKKLFSKLVVIENSVSGFGHTLDILMLLIGGTMRVAAEYEGLLVRGGKKPEVTPIPGTDKWFITTTIDVILPEN